MTVKITLVQTQDRLVNQIQQNIRQAVEPPFLQPSGSFVTTLTDCTTTPSATIAWEAGVDGRMVCLSLPTLLGTSNTTKAMLTGLPSGIWPKSQQQVLLQVQNNGTWGVGVLLISPTGTMTLFQNPAGTPFTASGTKGISQNTVVYARSV